jgi:hypothetical protein
MASGKFDTIGAVDELEAIRHLALFTSQHSEDMGPEEGRDGDANHL